MTPGPGAPPPPVAAGAPHPPAVGQQPPPPGPPPVWTPPAQPSGPSGGGGKRTALIIGIVVSTLVLIGLIVTILIVALSGGDDDSGGEAGGDGDGTGEAGLESRAQEIVEWGFAYDCVPFEAAVSAEVYTMANCEGLAAYHEGEQTEFDFEDMAFERTAGTDEAPVYTGSFTRQRLDRVDGYTACHVFTVELTFEQTGDTWIVNELRETDSQSCAGSF